MKKQTKKAKAFELFSQGYLPLSQEVKALGLHPSNRYKFYHQWEESGKPAEPPSSPSQPAMVSTKSPGGETIGGIDETRAKPKPAEALSQEEDIPEGVEDEGEEIAAPPHEKIKAQDESIGVVSEAAKVEVKGKEELERKIPTKVAEDGIKCVVFLSLQTLALYQYSASLQSQHDGEEELNLGDFLDTCAEDYYRGRGKKLGLIETGGK